MPNNSPSSKHKRNKVKGFAIIIALSLMGLVLLLILSLSSLIKVEIAQSTSNLDVRIAKENCYFALREAIGNIQKYTGKDQVTTARAELIIPNSQQPNSQPRWIGVWDTNADSPNYGERLAWLSSNANLEVINDDSYLKRASKNIITLEKGKLEDGTAYSVQQESQALPQGGRSSWWVDDEGLKHNYLHVSNDWVNQTEPYNFLSATKTGINGMRHLDALDLTDSTTRKQINKAFTLSSLGLVNDLDNQLKANQLNITDFKHCLTPYAKGVFSNSKNGGLKLDLTAGLQKNNSDLESVTNSNQIFPPVGINGIDSRFDPGGPLWSQLRSFYNIPEDLNMGTSFTQTVDAQALTDTQTMISPLIAQFNIWFYPILVNDGAEQWVRILVYPHITLWNPHNVTINAHTYYLRLARYRPPFPGHTADYYSTPPSAAVDMQRNDSTWVGGGGGIDNSNEALKNQLGHPVNTNNTSGIPIRKWEFGLDCPAIEPGKAIVFSPGSNISYQHIGAGFSSNSYLTNLLSPGLRSDKYLYCDTSLRAPIADTISNIHLFVEWQTPTMVTLAKDHIESESTPLHEWQRTYAYNEPSNQAGARAGPYRNIAAADMFSEASTTYSDIDVGAGVNKRPLIGFMIAPKRQNLSFGDTSDEEKVKFLGHFNYRAIHQHASFQDLYLIPNWQNTIASHSPNLMAEAKLSYLYEGMPVVGASEGIVGFDNQSNTRAILFDLPRSEAYFSSIGSLFHAPLTRPITTIRNFAEYSNWDFAQPTYPIGNSLAHPFLGVDRTHYHMSDGALRNRVEYDWSYKLNEALWDSYFFSTVDHDDPTKVFDQRKSIRSNANENELKETETAAKHLLLEGAFNINSTSKEAWKGFFSILKGTQLSHLSYNNTPQTYNESEQTPIAPYSYIRGDFVDDTVDYTLEEAFSGFRVLTNDEIDQLATEMVIEIKERGPFLSLSHFINRSANPSDPLAHKLNGAMQAAIDRTSINNSLQYKVSKSTYQSRYIQEYDNDAFEGDIMNDIPANVSQGKILQRLGNTISARSDTFRVRAYGEGPLGGKMWCEAVVQRIPDYIDSQADSAETFPANSQINQALGRKYQIVHFQWLNENQL